MAGTKLATKTPAEMLGIPVGLIGDAEPRSGDDVTDEIIAEMVAAGSVEKALAAGTVHGLKDFDGKALRFLDFAYRASSFAKDPATAWPFVVIKAATSDGELLTLTTGARQVVALLALARQTDGLPFVAKVKVSAFETADGERRDVVSLETV